MTTATSGASDTSRAYFARDFFTRSAETDARGLAELRLLLVGVGDAVEDLDRVALGRAVPQADDREPPNRSVRVARGELVQERPEGVDVARVVAREALERDERGAASGRALVLEAAAQKLELLPEPELRDRPIGLGADAVVGVARAGLDLLVPLRPQPRERRLVSRLCEGVRLGSRLGERHESDESERGPGPV